MDKSHRWQRIKHDYSNEFESERLFFKIMFILLTETSKDSLYKRLSPVHASNKVNTERLIWCFK